MARTMLITGAGSGIGRAAAVRLAQSADDVELVLVGRRAAPLEETAHALPRAASHKVVTASTADQAALQKALEPLELKTRNLVAVVANAGVGGSNQYGPDDRWREIIDTNLSGTYYSVSACIPALLAAKDRPCNVVLVASILARLGVPGFTAYCAAKAGMLGLMRSWAASFARKQVYFNAVLPGWVDTDMARDGIQELAGHTGKTYELARAEQLAAVPTGKMATPDEVASLIAYLVCGPQSSITGQCLDINNGALMA